MIKKTIIVFVVVACLIGVAGFAFIQTNTEAANPTNTNLQSFVINQGDGIRSISLRLEKNKLIRNDLVFVLLSYKMGLNSRLQAGTFKLSPSMTTVDVIQKLSKGGNNDYWLKIIEGQRIEELAVKFDKSKEGYLFPDSYLIPESYTTDQIIDLIADNFNRKLSQAKEGSSTSLSDSEAITLASIIEREARTLPSRQMVSGILVNRLQQGMALQVDASVQYARDSRSPKPKTYWLPVSKSDLKIVSSYNTYLNPGLPPAPICNPGYDSIYAAFHPTKSDYLFYITGNDNQMHYAKTIDEHNANIAKYL